MAPCQDLVIVTVLSKSITDVHMNTPEIGDLHKVTHSVSQMSYHDLFRNWYSFLPAHAKKKLQVLCVDEDCRRGLQCS